MTDEIQPKDFYPPINEAGGVCYVDMFTTGGVKISLTARALDPITALDSLIEAIQYGKQKYNLSGLRPEAPHAPTHTAGDPQSVSQTVASPTGQYPPPAGAPAPYNPPPLTPGKQQAVNAGDIEIVQVTSVTKSYTPNGKWNVKVMGGKYTKFGVTAWPEALPVDVRQAAEAWPVGTPFAPPPSMAYAYVTSKVNDKGQVVADKVTEFRA